MAGLRSSETYQWLSSDILGQGATGGVYRGWTKDTGEPVAVKTFNSIGLQRPQDVQNREFDILRSIKHPNIVRMFCVEEEVKTNEPCIIMELCTGGSLYNVLEEPEYIYGLKETDLKKLIKDVTSGMSYLREKDIIHRDIKPGNILLSDKSDDSCWKLTDFGAARMLHPEQQFQSLYGTEEYLHPSMYQRAVLNGKKNFGWDATVDLWSLAVTFYHASTGFLPFRPHQGPRKNQVTMGKMTKDRPKGAISATQSGSVTAEIVWSTDLPKTCRLTGQFRRSIVNLIATLMDGCTFDDYFKMTGDIEGLVPIWTYDCSSSRLFPVYVPMHSTVAQYKQYLKLETKDIKKQKQDFLIWNGKLIDSTLPKDTNIENSIIYLGASEKANLHLPHTAKPPKIGKFSSIDQDTQLGRVCCGTLYDISKSVQYFTQVEVQAEKAKDNITKVIEHGLLKLQMIQMEMVNTINNAEKVANMADSLNLIGPAGRRLYGAVKGLFEQANTVISQRAQLEAIPETKFPELPRNIYNKTRHCAHEAKEIYFHMKRRRASRSSSPAEMACHIGQRQRLELHCNSLIALFAEQTFPIMKKRHLATSEWFKEVAKFLRLVCSIKATSQTIARECDQLVDLTKQTVVECKTELEKLRNSDQKENQPNDKDHNIVSSIVAEKGLGNNLTTMDIENIASLVQGELQTIRQIILQNHSLIKTMKLRTNATSNELDLNDAIIDETIGREV